MNLRRSARIPLEELLTPEAPYEDEFEEQVFKEAPWSSDALLDGDQEVELIQLEGSEEFKAKLRALILKYRKVFSMTLREKPADIPPMWHTQCGCAAHTTSTPRMPGFCSVILCRAPM